MQSFPIYYRPAGEPSGPPAQFAAALACEDPTGGDNHRTNGHMWLDLAKLLKPLDLDRYYEAQATITKVTNAAPFPISMEHGGDDEPVMPSTLEDTVLIWATGDDDGDYDDDTMVSLTRQCIFVHDAAHWSVVEKLVGFAVLFGVPLVAGPHFNFVSEENFTGYTLPVKERPNASVLRMFDGGKGRKKPE